MKTALLPHPFKPLRSFLAYAVGDEKIELKPEWSGVVATPALRTVEPAERAA